MDERGVAQATAAVSTCGDRALPLNRSWQVPNTPLRPTFQERRYSGMDRPPFSKTWFSENNLRPKPGGRKPGK
eukprot:6742254-Pyramimonas_sp.AAC.1